MQIYNRWLNSSYPMDEVTLFCLDISKPDQILGSLAPFVVLLEISLSWIGSAGELCLLAKLHHCMFISKYGPIFSTATFNWNPETRAQNSSIGSSVSFLSDWFKIFLLVFKAFRGLVPASNRKLLLTISRTFCCSAPDVWSDWPSRKLFYSLAVGLTW